MSQWFRFRKNGTAVREDPEELFIGALMSRIIYTIKDNIDVEPAPIEDLLKVNPPVIGPYNPNKK